MLAGAGVVAKDLRGWVRPIFKAFLALLPAYALLLVLLLWDQRYAASVVALALGFWTTLLFLSVVVLQANYYSKHCVDAEDTDYKRCCEEGTREIWENFGLLLEWALRYGAEAEARSHVA